MDLRSYIGRRLLLLIPTVLGAIFFIFLLTQFLTPEQRASLYITSAKGAVAIPEVIEKYHLNDPFYVQFYHWIINLLHGNLGYSQAGNMTVAEAFVNFLPASLELFMYSTPIIIWAAIGLGTKSAVNKDEAPDHVSRVASIGGYAMPNFWLGLLLLLIGYGLIGIFGAGRLTTAVETYVTESPEFIRYTKINTIDAIINWDFRVLIDALKHLVLPVATLVVSSWALLTRITRSSMLEVLGKDFITAARAKGLEENTVINKHARRNALISVLTVSGYLVIGLLTGSFIVETIFNYKGIGWFFVYAANQFDFSVITGFTLIFALAIIFVNLIVDILYAYVDPRVRLE
ncbi:hypothetical protein AKJ62_00245 [candidate division MSBL1 archaeon SCGC-AAA259D14]|uniref:ABC transmembrane type-1 domain-containing protein n=1 Tax=candidate division MSBL1 archaeon SCGC-AAA259D14 TaxID=1698261 RepID=A0A133U8W0_9EURY|nr:hypothetical protein AKJ62_00245 [candidate division MSBL1 archaeon SCGC-AAA259D14]